MAADGNLLIYMLERDPDGRVVCSLRHAPFLNWKRFSALLGINLRDCTRSGSGLQLDAADRKILLRLIQHESRAFVGAVLADADGYDLVHDMVASGRAFLLKGSRLRIKWGPPVAATPVWETGADGLQRPGWQLASPCAALVATAPPCYIANDGRFDWIGPLTTPWPPDAARAWTAVRADTAADIEKFMDRFTHRYPGAVPPARRDAPELTDAERRPQPVVSLVRTERTAAGGAVRMVVVDRQLLVRLEFRYGTRTVSWRDDRTHVGLRLGGQTVVVPRQFDFERACFARLAALGLQPRDCSKLAMFDFHADDLELDQSAAQTWAALIGDALPALQGEGWVWNNESALQLAAVREAELITAVAADDGPWQTFAATIRFQGREVPVLPLLRDFLKANRTDGAVELLALFVRSTFSIEDGTGHLLLVPGRQLAPLVEVLFELGLQRPLDRAGRLRLSGWRARELGGLLTPAPDADRRPLATEVGPPLDLSRLRVRLLAGEHPYTPQPDPRLLFPLLRDYQCTGIGWLEFLDTVDAHGILADDMGLGKTFQVLAWLARRRACDTPPSPVLIVCPTSVMNNWIQEMAARVPELRVHLHHGPARGVALALGLANSSVVITNYPCLREDAQVLQAVEWDVVILDEAQAIKNCESQTFEVACGLRARRRLCISGTPLENRLSELWALMQFLMPFYLGTRDQFRDEFERSLVAGSGGSESRERAALLANRLAPFILRRTKEAVAPELPPRSEICHRVDLSPLQALRYEGVRASMVKEIRSLLETRTLAAAHIHIFDALTRLRLICCDPRIGSGGDPDLTAGDSAKFLRLFELLDELMAEERQILVFSQFVQMLDLVRAEVEARGWPFRLLTGQTVDRAEPVAAFQRGEVRLLLMSLKAGGTGLNLTAADSVILYDPWWNPAVERQASDRAHRIGQDKPVFVHRLIASQTVEEGMLALQERKRTLIEQVMQGLPSEGLVFDAATLNTLFGERVGDRA
jgi:hypothetical protein